MRAQCISRQQIPRYFVAAHNIQTGTPGKANERRQALRGAERQAGSRTATLTAHPNAAEEGAPYTMKEIGVASWPQPLKGGVKNKPLSAVYHNIQQV
eukprot:6179597-Pleurochrysis_carterae.AAC.2